MNYGLKRFPSGMQEANVKWLSVTLFFVLPMAMCYASQNPLTIKIIKTERAGKDTTYLLFSVENTSEQRFEQTTWSCVFFNKGQPVHEERSTVENVPPNGRAIERI
jgi:hypothetical protein